ncbi:MAG: MarR family winged helix-turn-helix transcriptional regulator [Solirubrobacteraceae bacterium]
MTDNEAFSDRDFARLLELRTRLRGFERWSAEQAAKHELTGSQHQLLLAIRGHAGDQDPTISEVAQYLMIGHNSAVGLADRTEKIGLIERHRDPDDHRVVRLTLTDDGNVRLGALTAAHIEELARVGPLIDALAKALTAS